MKSEIIKLRKYLVKLITAKRITGCDVKGKEHYSHLSDDHYANEYDKVEFNSAKDLTDFINSGATFLKHNDKFIKITKRISSRQSTMIVKAEYATLREINLLLVLND